MKSQLLSPSSFLRLPLIAWNAPPAIISDMSGPELLAMFAALAITGTPPTHVLKPTGQTTLPSGPAMPAPYLHGYQIDPPGPPDPECALTQPESSNG